MPFDGARPRRDEPWPGPDDDRSRHLAYPVHLDLMLADKAAAARILMHFQRIIVDNGAMVSSLRWWCTEGDEGQWLAPMPGRVWVRCYGRAMI